MPKKTLIITAIIVAVIALGATAVYIVQRQEAGKVRQKGVATTPEKPVVQPEEPTTTGPIDTANWKVYRNKEYGFELKYPKEWEIDEPEEGMLYFQDEFVITAPTQGLVFGVFPKGSKIHKEPQPDRDILYFPVGEIKGPIILDISINGQEALEKRYIYQDGSQERFIFFKKPPPHWSPGGYLLIYESQTFKEEWPRVRAILETFHLVGGDRI
jgi:hypothetical protein